MYNVVLTKIDRIKGFHFKKSTNITRLCSRAGPPMQSGRPAYAVGQALSLKKYHTPAKNF